MLYILQGPDDYSVRQSLEKIKESIGDQALFTANTTILEGQLVTPAQLRAASKTLPFLAEKRLVIIEGLLERFESRSKSSQQKKSRVPNRQNEYKSFCDLISNMPDSTILVLIDNMRKSSNNPLFRELSAKADVRSFPLLKKDSLYIWVKRRVAEGGGSISAQAVELLARLVGSNLWVMANEIDKLLIFASGRRVEEEDIRQLVSYAQDTSVFAMVDAILEFKVGVAERLLQQLLQGGDTPAFLLLMLSRQVHMIFRAKELRNQGKPVAEIQNRLGLTAEFALRKTLEQAGRYSLSLLKRVYQKLLEADLSIKTGKYDAELALNILIVELSQKQ